MSDKIISEEALLALAIKGGGGGGGGDGDMKKSVYDTDNNGIVDNAEKVNNHTVDKDVPSDAKFTDTVYDDTAISNRVSGIEEVIPKDATSSNPLATESDIPTVVANPSGSASAGDLTKIQIGDNIYEIPSGGGSASGGGLTADVLYSRGSYPSQSVAGTKRTYTMAHSIDDYDAVYVLGWTYWNSASGYEMLDGRLIFKSEYYLKPTTDPTEYWTHFINGSYSNSTRHLLWIFDNNTTLKSVSETNEGGNEPILYKVYGLKFGAGVAKHISYDNTTSGLTADNVQDAIDEIAASGGGNTVSKTRYQISSSSWSSSANSDGFYTLTATLNPAIGSSPDVYVAGSADGTQPTDTEKGQFAYVKRCKVNGSTLTLYASSKPSSTFYIWVEGVNGTGSGDIVGNVIQPNGASGAVDYSTSEVATGEHWIDGKMIYKKTFSFTLSTMPSGATSVWSGYTTDIRDSETIIKCESTLTFTTEGVTVSRTPYDKPEKGYCVYASRNKTDTTYPMSLNAYHYDSLYDGGTITATVYYTKL